MNERQKLLSGLFSEEEWELLCDFCALCCLYKIRDDDTNEVFYTKIMCPFMNKETKHCNCYYDRFDKMPTCAKISVKTLPKIAAWLPKNCAYRCLYEGIELPEWHPILADSSDEALTIRQKISSICVRPNTCISKKTADRIVNSSKPAPTFSDLNKLLIDNVIEDLDI